MLAPSGLPTTPLVAMFIQQTGLSNLEKESTWVILNQRNRFIIFRKRDQDDYDQIKETGLANLEKGINKIKIKTNKKVYQI